MEGMEPKNDLDLRKNALEAVSVCTCEYVCVRYSFTVQLWQTWTARLRIQSIEAI